MVLDLEMGGWESAPCGHHCGSLAGCNRVCRRWSVCPECGQPIHIITDKCPACGYWLSPGDRHAMWSGMRKPTWLRVTAWVVLAAFLITLLAIGLTIF